jgi:hypothetical protein
LEEKQRRERDHKAAMERIAQDHANRREARNQMAKLARENGYCLHCLERYDKQVRHRAHCPRSAQWNVNNA